MNENEEKKLPQIKLADDSEYDCTLCGYARTTGRLLIELPGLKLIEAVGIFDDNAKTAEITMPYDEGDKTYKGFEVLESVDVLEDGGVRVSLRRRYVEETTNDQ